jgi:hypothetical protein
MCSGECRCIFVCVCVCVRVRARVCARDLFIDDSRILTQFSPEMNYIRTSFNAIRSFSCAHIVHGGFDMIVFVLFIINYRQYCGFNPHTCNDQNRNVSRFYACVCVRVCACVEVIVTKNNATTVMKPVSLGWMQCAVTIVFVCVCACVCVRVLTGTIRWLFDNSYPLLWYVCTPRATKAVHVNTNRQSNSLLSLNF